MIEGAAIPFPIPTACVPPCSRGYYSRAANPNPSIVLENVEHCGGEPEQAANGFGIGFVIGFVTSK